jgi:hypothetical protein
MGARAWGPALQPDERAAGAAHAANTVASAGSRAPGRSSPRASAAASLAGRRHANAAASVRAPARRTSRTARASTTAPPGGGAAEPVTNVRPRARATRDAVLAALAGGEAMTASQVAPAPGSRAGPSRPPCLGSRAASICGAPTADTVLHPQAERHPRLSHNRGRRRNRGPHSGLRHRRDAYADDESGLRGRRARPGARRRLRRGTLGSGGAEAGASAAT